MCQSWGVQSQESVHVYNIPLQNSLQEIHVLDTCTSHLFSSVSVYSAQAQSFAVYLNNCKNSPCVHEAE